MLLLFKTFLAVVPSILRSRAAVELENLALRHQIGVLQRSAAKRAKLSSGDGLFWICLSRLWRDWRSALAIVKPETSWLGIAPRFDGSGPGKCGVAYLDDPSFPTRCEI